MAERLFTSKEVEQLIPRLEQIVGTLMDNKRQAMEIGQDLAKIQELVKQGNEKQVKASDLQNKQTELEFLVRVINDGLDAIEEMGGQPKDLDMGLVDFPAEIDGEEALLCWKLGEKSIRFYHGLREGFSGRKPLMKG